MAITVGTQLRQARLKKGLTIEEIAHETRIPPASLESLEEDDYSIFPNPTYAKSFLLLYANYLEVDASEMAEALSAPKSKGLGGPSLAQGPPPIDLSPSDSTIPIFKLPEERTSSPSLATFSLIALLVVLLPTVYLMGKRSGFQEQASQALSSTANSGSEPQSAMETGVGVGLDDPQPERAEFEPPPPLPNAEFNKLIGIAPPKTNRNPSEGEADGSLPLLNPDSDLDN